MRIVHAADLHIDSPLRGLERYEGAPADTIRGATRRAMENLVALCLEEKAALLLLAGDLFDGGWKDYATGLFFSKQMARLREGDVQVVLLRGNHDAASEVARHLPHADHVRELSTRQPESVAFEKLGVTVHGRGFASKAVTEDLAARYPAARGDGLDIGLLHTCLSGREGHEPYAPTSTTVLADKEYDYWALGHVHTREVVSDAPWMVFPGNIQGRHAKETGPKGATLIDVDGGRIVSVEARTLDVVRWSRVTVSAAGAEHRDEVIDRARAAITTAAREADGRPCCLRIVIDGVSGAHDALARDPARTQADIRAVAMDADESVWIERVQLGTRPVLDRAAAAERDDAVGELVRGLVGAKHDPATVAAIVEDLAELRRKLPQEARDGEGSVDLESELAIAALLDEVEQMLVPRLLSEEDA